MLPDGFSWLPRHQYAQDELALECNGRQVAMLMRRMDGGWIARLWAHWPPGEPVVSRRCSSAETGKAGIEQWASRHQERIRAEVAAGRRMPSPYRAVTH